MMANLGFTKVDHIYQDFVAPTLEPGERICMDYIIRRTTGFTDGKGGRKERDTIALSQFVNGIRMGEYQLDLGTGLTENTVKRALKGLQEKELVEIRWACTKCFWEQNREEKEPDTPANTKNGVPLCPRCKRTLSRNYARAPLTINKVKMLINEWSKTKDEKKDEKNKQHIVYGWDKEIKRFTWQKKADPEAIIQEQKTWEDEKQRLENSLWYPELVEEAVKQSESKMTAGKKMSIKRTVENFYKPIWQLQEEFPTPPLIEYALKQTLKNKIPAGQNNRNWHRYTRAICNKNNDRYLGRVEPKNNTNEANNEQYKLQLQIQAIHDLLNRAAILNGKKETEAARELLSEILADKRITVLSALFEGNKEKTEYQLRLAFKQGTSDFQGVIYDQYGLDFYPEWKT